MITDKDLIRRALLGSREAQEECTRQEIVLPCPKCGKGKIIFWDKRMKWYSCWDCGLKSGPKKSFGEALRDWNTRPAPPVGRCRDCFRYHSEGPGVGYCSLDDQGREETNFCSEFEPKED